MVLGEVCKGSRNVSLTFWENKISNICILIQHEFSLIINTWVQKFSGSLLHVIIDMASLMKLKTYMYKAPSRGLKPINSSNNYSQNYVENNLEPVLTQAASALPTELMVPQSHRTHCSLDSHFTHNNLNVPTVSPNTLSCMRSILTCFLLTADVSVVGF